MKRLLAILMALAVLCSFAACSDDAASAGDNKQTANVTVDMKAVLEKLKTDLELVDPLDITTERACVLYFVEPADVKDSACAFTMGGAFPDEMIIFEAVDGEAAARVAEKLEAHLASTINQAENYDADSLSLLKECKVEIAGNYVHLFISAKSAQMREIFDAAKK